MDLVRVLAALSVDMEVRRRSLVLSRVPRAVRRLGKRLGLLCRVGSLQLDSRAVHRRACVKLLLPDNRVPVNLV
jgi:hypothetical protein